MATDRRQFLRALAAATLLGPLRTVAGADRQLMLSCRSSADGRHFASLFDDQGEVLLDAPLPARGHGITLNRRGDTAVVFARRPGGFLVVIDLPSAQVVRRLRTPADRHLFGHGVFSADDRLLLTTENDFARGEGRIGVYDAADGFRRLDGFASHGIGPHELQLLADGSTLVVANGGILTHPDMPRAKLNLDTMRSTLSYLDAEDGLLLAEYAAPWQKLSIRHLDLSPAGQVAAVMQYEGPKTDRPPLVMLQRPGEEPRWLLAPDAVQQRMRNYCGSVAFSSDGTRFAVSSPRGGLLTHWAADGEYLGDTRQADVCGIAAGRTRLWFSDGRGGLRHDAADRPQRFADTRWDNHMTAWNTAAAVNTGS